MRMNMSDQQHHTDEVEYAHEHAGDAQKLPHSTSSLCQRTQQQQRVTVNSANAILYGFYMVQQLQVTGDR